MAGLSASGLKTQIKSYTEVDSTVLSDSVLENIILNAQYKIFRDIPIDANRRQQLGNLVAGQESINCPAGAVFIRGIQVYDTNGSATISVNEPDHGRSTSDTVRFRNAEVVGGVAAATINLAAGYTITKVDDDNYTFATATSSSITESGGGGFASAGPVTVTA